MDDHECPMCGADCDCRDGTQDISDCRHFWECRIYQTGGMMFDLNLSGEIATFFEAFIVVQFRDGQERSFYLNQDTRFWTPLFPPVIAEDLSCHAKST